MKKRQKRLTIIASLILGFLAFSALLYIKIGRERLMLWYYKYLTHENIIKAIPFLAALVVLGIIALIVIWRLKKQKAKRAREKTGIDLRDLFSDAGPL